MDIIQEIKSRLSVEELYTREFPGHQLVRRGNRLWTICPFHQEKTPSFCIDTSKKRFRCYGCNLRGDVIELYAQAHNLENREAIRQLAAELGITRDASPKARKAAQEARRKREEEKLLDTDLSDFLKATREDCFNIEKWIHLIKSIVDKQVTRGDYAAIDRPGAVFALQNIAHIEYLADTFVSGTNAEQMQAALAFRRWRQSQVILTL
ncbi:MAG TPA: hypothetical protein DD791_07980 [Syntrophomonas sp.]|jgi:hypothetical protein|nr:hypothetical protein [Syntrophomonas sp.]